jgi:hypothetical protein
MNLIEKNILMKMKILQDGSVKVKQVKKYLIPTEKNQENLLKLKQEDKKINYEKNSKINRI